MSVPPAGTVTFLFTDIEGSTALWEHEPEAMRKALARHDEILTRAIEANGGFVFKTVGDAFCAAFNSASDALGAALASQRALHCEPWDEGCVIRARMAIHAGEAEERGGDYFGPTLNRVARLLSAGHGGQTLLSKAASTPAEEGLSHSVELRDMGERRLKDLTHPVRIYELTVPDLPDDFPPLKTLDAVRNNLPPQPTPLIGRGRQVDEIREELHRRETRLLTLVGPGGTGKTRLSLQVAADTFDEYPDGVFFVDLAPLNDPTLVATTIARTLGLPETAERTTEELLKEYARSRKLLLVLDNFEQVLEATPLVGEILAVGPNVRVLATSRVPLRVYGEREYPVPPLALPDPKRPPSLDDLDHCEAVRLFVERAQAVKRGFELTDENAPVIAEICARLDGLPLAIELAAARSKILSPGAMLGRLDSRLKLLKGGARNLPERQRTLRAAIDWSHELLNDQERTLFARLSVFAGGRTFEAIEEVCDPEGELDGLDGIESMVGESLLRQQEGPDEEPRFVMLETIHEYAREKLEESGEAEEVKGLHAEYFLTLAEQSEAGLKGPDQVEWLERMEAEHDNFRAALSWSLGREEADLALRLAGALWWFWFVQSHFAEGRRFLEAALLDGAGSAATRARALFGAGRMILEQGDGQRATELLEEAVESLRGTQEEERLAEALNYLGIAAISRNDLTHGTALVEESLALFQRSGNRWGFAETNINLGVAAYLRGDLLLERRYLEESLSVSRSIGDRRGILLALNNLSVNWRTKDLEKAGAMAEEALGIARDLGLRFNIALGLNTVGAVAVVREDLERVAELIEESLHINKELGSPYVLHENLVCLAALAAARGDDERAVRVLGAAEALHETTEILGDLSPEEDYPNLYHARSRIGEIAWNVAWAKGHAMTPEQAIAVALESKGDFEHAAKAEPA